MATKNWNFKWILVRQKKSRRIRTQPLSPWVPNAHWNRNSHFRHVLWTNNEVLQSIVKATANITSTNSKKSCASCRCYCICMYLQVLPPKRSISAQKCPPSSSFCFLFAGAAECPIARILQVPVKEKVKHKLYACKADMNRMKTNQENWRNTA